MARCTDSSKVAVPNALVFFQSPNESWIVFLLFIDEIDHVFPVGLNMFLIGVLDCLVAILGFFESLSEVV